MSDSINLFLYMVNDLKIPVLSKTEKRGFYDLFNYVSLTG